MPYTDKQLLMVARDVTQCISLKAPDVTFSPTSAMRASVRTPPRVRKGLSGNDAGTGAGGGDA